MKIFRLTCALTSLAVLLVPPATSANESSPFDAEPFLICGAPPNEVILEYDAQDQLLESDPMVAPFVENPEILQTLTCVEAKLPISRAQQAAAQMEVLSIGEDYRAQFEAEANFLITQIRLSGPRNGAVFQALLKALQNRRQRTQSALLVVLRKLDSAEIINEEDSTN